jgi:predicted NBD/HSP70 family sugar kinase
MPRRLFLIPCPLYATKEIPLITVKTCWPASSSAVTIVSVINSFDPELILIGGGVANAWADLEGRLKPHLDRYEWRPAGHRVPVVRATLGEWSGCYGAV